MIKQRIANMFLNILKMLKRFSQQYEKLILKPVKVFPYEFFIVLLLLCIPVIYTSYDSCILRLKEGLNSVLLRHNNGQFIFDVALSYIVITCGYLLYRINKFGYFFIITAELLLSIIAIVELFLYDNFHMDINYNIFQFINETNDQESSEFISTYIFKFDNLKYPLILLICLWLQLKYCTFFRTRLAIYCPKFRCLSRRTP